MIKGISTRSFAICLSRALSSARSGDPGAYDLTGSFTASLWALFGTALLLVGACLPLSAKRLRPV